MPQTIDIRILRAGDEHVLTAVAPDVFDRDIDEHTTREFLADRRHHLAVALDGGVVVGFASGVHYLHPDKPRPELWINEIAVAPTHRRRGIARRLLTALLEEGRGLGCTEAWLAVDRDNRPAMELYASTRGARLPQTSILFTFDLDAIEPP